ncbi:MAG: DnaJ domain-containing protein [Desulfobulbaceae bacterium]|nr:MAG: DnaJ domain-containing protein [Desulfobulbaceae bacterium]
MRSADRDNIRRLLKRLGRDYSTESHITFVAENTGLLQSCRNVLAAEREGRQETIDWLRDACAENGVAYPHCLQEIGRILQLFQPGIEQDQHYAELGLAAGASDEEVKRAYRRLSIKYHPDTARETGEETTDKFIRLTRAYHAIIAGEDSTADAIPAAGGPPPWSYGTTKKALSGRLSPKAVLGGVLLIGALIAVCLVSSEMYSRKVMLSTLHGGGAAFIPPVRKGAQDNSQSSMTFAEKLRSNGEAVVASEDAGTGGGKAPVAGVVAEKEVPRPPIQPAIPDDQAGVIDEGRKKVLDERGSGDSSVAVGVAGQKDGDAAASLVAQAVIGTEPADAADGPVAAAKPHTEQPGRKTVDQHEANVTLKTEEGPVAGQQITPAAPAAAVEASSPTGNEEPRLAVAKMEERPAAVDAGAVQTERKAPGPNPPHRQQAGAPLPTAAEPVDGQQGNVAPQTPDKPALPPPAVAKTAPAVAHAAVTGEERQKPEESLQKNIDAFLRDYSAAYGQKNMAGFLEFFNDDATENGKPVVDLIPTYAHLFEATESIGLQIAALNWQETAKDKVTLHCSFSIDLAYRNANAVHGTGKIDFRLVQEGSAMKIQQMSYSFDQ